MPRNAQCRDSRIKHSTCASWALAVLFIFNFQLRPDHGLGWMAGAEAAEYLGCFRDQGDPQGLTGRDLAGAIMSAPTMTGAQCVATCQAKGYAYAGTQYGSYCFCGDSYGKSGPAKCGMPCAGNPGEMCGGPWANSVYAVAAQPGALPPLTQAASTLAPRNAQTAPAVANQAANVPTLWVFADIKVTVLGPITLKVVWQSRLGATSYRVFRNDTAIADFPEHAPPLMFIDDGLPPGETVSYRVQAIQTVRSPSVMAPKMAPGDAIRSAAIAQEFTVLEESRTVSATTPLAAGRFPVLYVDAASLGGDGSQAMPFKRIADAIASGSGREVRAVNIRLAPGRYDESIQIVNNTSIDGAPNAIAELHGKIDNVTGQTLAIRNLTIRGSVKYALMQQGGSLIIENTIVRDGVRAGDQTAEDGAAIRISGGAQARITDVQVLNNSGPGLHVEGAHTRLWALRLRVHANQLNPIVIARFSQGKHGYAAGVEVAGGASAWIDASTISQNQAIGLLVQEASSVYLRNVALTATQPINGVTGPTYGVNVLVLSRSVVEFEGLTSEQSEFGAELQESYVTGLTGIFRDNVIGIGSVDPSPDPSYEPLSCIHDEVRFINNQIKTGNILLPFPCLHSTTCYQQCKQIPWVPAPSTAYW